MREKRVCHSRAPNACQLLNNSKIATLLFSWARTRDMTHDRIYWVSVLPRYHHGRTPRSPGDGISPGRNWGDMA